MRLPDSRAHRVSLVPSRPKLLQNKSLEHFLLELIFANITKLIPPEDFLCNVAATGVSLFARKQAKEFAL